ncbi:MAG: hypothetical protein WCJ30_14415, partial [Deltaproteobacteria bacterium]
MRFPVRTHLAAIFVVAMAMGPWGCASTVVPADSADEQGLDAEGIDGGADAGADITPPRDAAQVQAYVDAEK